jgi:hypothetical protein
MEWINTLSEVLIALFTGVFLRLALPLGLTVLVIAWLRWLDARWQQDAEVYQAEKGGSRVSILPCWSILGCPDERREKCPAYHNREKPCWQLFRGTNDQLRQECLDCQVFREAPVPVAA